MKALEKLLHQNRSGKFICIGLDTDKNKIPSYLLKEMNPILSFNRQIIEATFEDAAAYKLNFAFYEKSGSAGMDTLMKTIEMIPQDIMIIGDAKRGDIGNTSAMYAESVFNLFSCDSVTINPYMGEDSVKPFLDFSDKLIFILALTSNPGAEDFEKLKLSDGTYLFQEVIRKIHAWNKGNCGLVFGATKLQELSSNMDLIGELPVLLPGIGTQGGSLEEVIRVFQSRNRINFLANVSRGIIYKSPDKNFAAAASNELKRLNNIVSENMQI